MGSQPDIDAWINNAARYPLLPPERVHAIATQIQSLPEDSPKRKKLVNKLVNHNLRLVIRFVHSFMRNSHCKWGCDETVDYLQMGALGLVRAAEKFDPTRGYKFSTYANHWIRSGVSRYNMKTMTPVSIGESVSRQIVYYKRNGTMKYKSNGRQVSDVYCQEIIRAASLAYGYVSLDQLNSSDNPIGDSIVYSDQSSPVNMLEFGRKVDTTLTAIGVPPLAKEVLLASSVYEEKTVDIAERLGISIDQVRTEKKKAIQIARRHQGRVLDGIL